MSQQQQHRTAVPFESQAPRVHTPAGLIMVEDQMAALARALARINQVYVELATIAPWEPNAGMMRTDESPEEAQTAEQVAVRALWEDVMQPLAALAGVANGGNEIASLISNLGDIPAYGPPEPDDEDIMIAQRWRAGHKGAWPPANMRSQASEATA